MDFIASLTLQSNFNLSKLIKILNDVLNVDFKKDNSGFYEEFPAYVSTFIGIEIALLNPNEISSSLKEYQLILRSIEESLNDDLEVDLSLHLKGILRKTNIICNID
ncbi:MAG: hypothetical protein COB02_07170 [Candidatus Cloacimonadota bacterium]|nr:MAG: hypothetical protein COB02_07170 [Candidatus Cloacimonadota bacterium]